MPIAEESKIRRDGFAITSDDATHLLDFIDLHDPRHTSIEPEIVVRLELLSHRWHLKEGNEKEN